MGSKKKRNTPPVPAQEDVAPARAHTAPRRKSNPVYGLLVLGVVAIFVIGGITAAVQKHASKPEGKSVSAKFRGFDHPSEDSISFAEIQTRHLITDVHEHIGGLDRAPIYLEVMDKLGIGKMCLMGSSKFTLTLDEKYGFTGYDENNEELLRIVQQYPGRFEAWPTVNPLDPDKLAKFKDLVSRGATGLKLYIGHGFLTKKNEYMFHPVAMDDPGMMPLYQYCAENFIPVCIHVNPYDGKPGFAEEFVAVLTAFPDLKVVCPHFMLSSVRSFRLQELLDVFPNLYTDVSFGDFFMKDRLKYISKAPTKFKKIFNDYADRFMYGTDIVLINSPKHTRAWVEQQHQAYLDMLTKATYTTPLIPNETLNGVELPDWLLDHILYKNFEAFSAKKPKGTVLKRAPDWSRMSITPLDRKPGQAFPPPPPKKKGADSE